MPSRLGCAALTALLAAPAALAAGATSLTIYHADGDALFTGGSPGTLDAGHAVVHEQRELNVASGGHDIRIDGLPSTVDPEAIMVGFGSNQDIEVLGQRVLLGKTGAGAVGHEVTVSGIGGSGASGGSITGELVGASQNGQIVRTPDGALHLIHQYATMTMPKDAYSRGSTLVLDVDAKSAGQRDAQLTYTTAGLGWRAAYSAMLAQGGACRMQLKPEASIANRSGRDYDAVGIQLVAGQPNLGNRPRMYNSIMSKGPTPTAAQAMPVQAPLGDYRSFTLPGAVTLPTDTVTLTPLYPPRELGCDRAYVVEDGNVGFPPKPNTNDYGAQAYQDRPIASTLAFTAPEALPAGTLRAWIADHQGAPALLGEGGIADTPKGQRVDVQLGQSFDLRASRERTAFHVDASAHRMTESYRMALANGGDVARTVTVREHPDRWREWRVTESSSKPAKQTPQLLEFQVPVPAHGDATLTWTVQYVWTAQDL
ncbi:MAG: DUF4139 domain-containing protein [Rhodanobacteraceae bacterium]